MFPRLKGEKGTEIKARQEKVEEKEEEEEGVRLVVGCQLLRIFFFFILFTTERSGVRILGRAETKLACPLSRCNHLFI